jgi:polyisoprenoid-binding protein YceI
MSIKPGTHKLGPEAGTLFVKTGRKGAAAKAGHDLLIEVTAWSALIEVAADSAPTRLELTAEAGSLRVREGTGGLQSLGDDDKDNIRQTIGDEVLKGTAIAFRSTGVRSSENGSRLNVDGELELFGQAKPLAFALAVEPDGRLTGAATVKQSDWGIKPYSALFGALKVADEVTVAIDARMPAT